MPVYAIKPRTLALILAGGRVGELDVLTAYRPKSAVPFGGFARVIDFPLSNLMRSGLERVAILSQYRCYSLINHIGNGAPWDMVGRYRGISILPPFQGSNQSSWYKGTADAVYQNLDFVQYHDPEEVLILSGDHVYNMDYRPLIDYHRAKDADLTIACLEVPMETAHRFGVAAIDGEDGDTGGRVLHYQEKPAKPEYNWASLTVYCFKPKVLYEVLAVNAARDDSHEFGRNIIPRLMNDRRRIYGYKFKGYWGYTRTIEEYWQTSMDLLGDTPRIKLDEWGIRTNLDHRAIRDRQPLITGEQAAIEDSLVYNGCTVEGEVRRSILFPGVHVKKGAVVEDSILFFDTVIGRDAAVHRSICDVNVTIGAGARLGLPGGRENPISVIGLNNMIAENSVLAAGAIVPPLQQPARVTDLITSGGRVL